MGKLLEYFSDEKIIDQICKYRIKYSKKRHKIHLIRDVSNHASTNLIKDKKYLIPSELTSILPPRRKWTRLKENKRIEFRNSQELYFYSLKRTILNTRYLVSIDKVNPPLWYNNLMEFIYDVRNQVKDIGNLEIGTPQIKPIIKDREKDQIVCRPIAIYDLRNRIIIGLTAKYLTKVFDNIFLNCSYAFRAITKERGSLTHHDAVKDILKIRKYYKNGTLWVSECDIKKFFDCVNHKTIKNIFIEYSKFLEGKGIFVDELSRNIFNKYLDSYSFNEDVDTLNGTNFFENYKINNGLFGWTKEELLNKYYPDGLDNERIGIPQGGAISCLIANMILHKVDEEVLNIPGDNTLHYFRFCDDMILLSPSKVKCEEALERYKEALKKYKLLIHEPKNIGHYDKKFWDSKLKSKKPYLWAARKEETQNVPWLSFVGYNIRYDGCLRVRKKSINKELQKQRTETEIVLKAIKAKNNTLLNLNSRKSKHQQIYALENRLISMSVGRVKIYLKSYTPNFCWLNGFKLLSPNKVVYTQLKNLDRVRNKQLYLFKKKLIPLDRKSTDKDKFDNIQKYFGAPFSYFGSLLKWRKK